MAMKTYTSVIDWVAAEYSRSTPKVKPYDAGTLSRVGQIVRHVHPHSPAGQLGIQKGDILHEINGGPFDAGDIDPIGTHKPSDRSYRVRRIGRMAGRGLCAVGCACLFGWGGVAPFALSSYRL